MMHKLKEVVFDIVDKYGETVETVSTAEQAKQLAEGFKRGTDTDFTVRKVTTEIIYSTESTGSSL